MQEDNTIQLNYGMFPFRLRFSNTYKLYEDIKELVVILDQKINQLNKEINDKVYIRNLLNANFIRFGVLIKQILMALTDNQNLGDNTGTNTVVDNFFLENRKTFSRLLDNYTKYRNEYSGLEKVKDFTVSLKRIPNQWKFGLLRKEPLSVSKEPGHQVNQVTPWKKENNTKTRFDKDIRDIKRKINLIRKRIEHLKSRITFLNQCIIWLFIRSKETMQCFMKFIDDLNQLKLIDPQFSIIRKAIMIIFEIEQKICFNSEPVNIAYEFKTSTFTTHMKIIATEKFQVI